MKLKDKIYWRLLKRSPIFRYWYRKTCWEAYYDLEITDVPGERKYLMAKWRTKAGKL